MKRLSKLILFMLIVISAITPVETSAVANNEITVELGGEPFGIKMFSDGLMVVKTESFVTNGREYCPAESAGIKANDIIYSANNTLLKTSSELKKTIENCNGGSICLKIKRDEKYIDIKLTPQKNEEGIYKAGLWVKDSAAGLGTITFYDSESKCFCGLGHGICDGETGALIPISSGEVDEACISSVTKSSCGNVGTLNGYFTDNVIGKAIENDVTGVYGIKYNSGVSKDEITIAQAQEVVKGKAFIYTTIDGNEPQKYEIEIVRINLNDETINMVIKITDKKLLDITGGIVQGMSGSPIVQNNKLVGAVTHVLVDDVVYGYAIFAETMYYVLDEIC